VSIRCCRFANPFVVIDTLFDCRCTKIDRWGAKLATFAAVFGLACPTRLRERVAILGRQFVKASADEDESGDGETHAQEA
jgi:hypothetical protein